MGWLTGWAKRIKLTIDYTLVDSNLTDFPVMIKVTDESVFDEITSEDDRYKIAVTASDGTTQCYVEIERWDQTNKLAILHTIISSVSSTADTIIYLYYDAGHADNKDYVGDTQVEDSNYVWLGDSFEAIFHMAQVPTGTILDSGLMGNNATSGGSMTAGDLIDGLVGKAIDFDGQDDRLDLLAAVSLSGAFSISILGKITSYTHEPGIACNGATWASGRIAIKSSADALWLGSADTVSLSETLPTDTWFLFTITRDGSNNIKAYKNGADITSGSPSFSGTLSIDRICDNPDNVVQKSWYGPVDEFRVSSSCLPAAWIKATYYSLIDGLIKARDCGESWTDLGQQYGQGYIYSMAYCANGIALAGTATGGKILRSTDYGANWSDLGQQASEGAIWSLAYCANGIALAGTGSNGKILRSTNYGANWSDLGQQFSQSYIQAMAYLENGIALAGTGDGGKILRSTDYGATWSDLGQQGSETYIRCLCYLENGIALAGTAPNGKIFRSTDYGATWQDLGQQASQANIFSLIYLGNGIALAGSGTGTNGAHILRSIDYGATWQDLGQQASQINIYGFAYPGNGIVLAGTHDGGKILRSTDYGATWTDLGQQASETSIRCLAYCGGGIALAGTATNGKILRSVATILRAEEQSIYSMPAAELSLLHKHPIMIPFYIRVPAATMSLSLQDPSWVWDINRMCRITYTLKLTLGTSVTIPISSFQCRTKQVPASIIYDIWEAGVTYYPLNSYVIPTIENGYYYRCIGAIQVWDPNNPLEQTEPIWPTKRGIYVCDGKYYWRVYSTTGIVYSVALSAVIPDISWAAEVTARSTGVIKTYQNFHFTNGQTQTHLLIRALAERITIDEYAKSGRITLYGYEIKQNRGSKRVELSGQSYRRLDGGKLRYRCKVNPFLQLGDRADINDELFYVNEINYTISPREQIMEISE